jgi:hypothetical protein
MYDDFHRVSQFSKSIVSPEPSTEVAVSVV